MSKQVIVKEGRFEGIYCKGEHRGLIGAGMDRRRMCEVAMWILGNAVSRIAGPTENALRDWLAGRSGPTPLGILREFNHRVP